MENTGSIFVYGTLKVGGFYSSYFDNFRTNVKQGYILGELYNFGYFPALVLPGKSIVHGEIHDYLDFDLVLSMMDEIEGHPDFYKRNHVTATADNNDLMEIIAYSLVDKELLRRVKKESAVLKIKEGVWKFE